MGRDRRHKRRNRPPAGLRGPGKQERKKRDLPPRGEAAPEGTTIFVTAETPKQFYADVRLATTVTRGRGLPGEVAAQGYLVAERLLQQPDLELSDFGKVATGVAALARADAETGRYQDGEPVPTINVNSHQNTMHGLVPMDNTVSATVGGKARPLPP